jgi:hypothetical protein
MSDPEAVHANLRDDLRRLLEEVERTRAAQVEARTLGRGDVKVMLPAQQASLGALEAYVDALDRQGWPAPPQMRQDLRLLRSLCGRRHRW